MNRRETSSTLLCGFTITGGYGNDGGLSSGGGIHLFDNANPILSDLIITGNEANSGAAIGALHGSSPAIRNTLIYGNTCSVLGYAVRFHNGSNSEMTNVTIADNHIIQASVGLSYGSTLTVKNSII